MSNNIPGTGKEPTCYTFVRDANQSDYCATCGRPQAQHVDTPPAFQEFCERVWDTDEADPVMALMGKDLKRIFECAKTVLLSGRSDDRMRTLESLLRSCRSEIPIVRGETMALHRAIADALGEAFIEPPPRNQSWRCTSCGAQELNATLTPFLCPQCHDVNIVTPIPSTPLVAGKDST